MLCVMRSGQVCTAICHPDTARLRAPHCGASCPRHALRRSVLLRQRSPPSFGFALVRLVRLVHFRGRAVDHIRPDQELLAGPAHSRALMQRVWVALGVVPMREDQDVSSCWRDLGCDLELHDTHDSRAPAGLSMLQTGPRSSNAPPRNGHGRWKRPALRSQGVCGARTDALSHSGVRPLRETEIPSSGSKKVVCPPPKESVRYMSSEKAEKRSSGPRPAPRPEVAWLTPCSLKDRSKCGLLASPGSYR